MLPANNHHKSASITNTIDFHSEQSPFYAESIQYAKQSYKNKTHIPPEERNLVFPQSGFISHHHNQASPMREQSAFNWFDDEEASEDNTMFDAGNKLIPNIAEQANQSEDIFLGEGSCDDDMESFFAVSYNNPQQQPAPKKVKYSHESAPTNSNMLETVSSPSSSSVASSSQDNNLLSILLREQQKQGAEISELKNLVHNLQAQIMMHPMYQHQFMLYQQQQQQQYQLYLQKQSGNDNTSQ